MFQIAINGIIVSNLKPVKKVRTISIKTGGGYLILPRKQAQNIVDYIFKAVQKCKGAIIFNGVIVEKKSVKYMNLGV